MADPAFLTLGALLVLVLVGAWRGLVRHTGPAARLRAWGGNRTRGDGVVLPLEVLGQKHGRLYTVGWQARPGADDVLLVGVDCAAPDGSVSAPDGSVPAPDGGVPAPDGGPTREAPAIEDGVLAVRIVRPDPALLDGPRLEALLDELCALAAACEAQQPSAGTTDPRTRTPPST